MPALVPRDRGPWSGDRGAVRDTPGPDLDSVVRANIDQIAKRRAVALLTRHNHGNTNSQWIGHNYTYLSGVVLPPDGGSSVWIVPAEAWNEARCPQSGHPPRSWRMT